MFRVALLLLALSACAPGFTAMGGGVADGCERSGMVNVYVVNQTFSDIRIRFGSYQPARAALALTTSTYSVPRSDLRYSVSWRVVRGGIDMGSPPIDTVDPDCNEATLFIMPNGRGGIFFGADVRRER